MKNIFFFIQGPESDPEDQTPKLNHGLPSLKSKKLNFAEQATVFEDSESVMDERAIDGDASVDDHATDGDASIDNSVIVRESTSRNEKTQSQDGPRDLPETHNGAVSYILQINTPSNERRNILL